MPSRCASNPDPVFTHAFIDPARINVIIPPGSISGDVKPHSYIQYRPSADLIPIHAPRRMRLDSMSYYDENARDQYILFFEVSCEVSLRFDHLTGISDRILPYRPTKDTGTQGKPINGNLYFEAGEIVGYVGGGDSNTFDFGIYNTARPNGYSDFPRFADKTVNWNNYLYGDCAYRYFEDSLAKQYYEFFGSFGKVVRGTPCRLPSRNERGKLVGLWFQDVPTPKGQMAPPYLAIAKEPTGEVRIHGALLPSRFFMAGVDPAEVTDAACYTDRVSYVTFWLSGVDEVQVVHGSGLCPRIFDLSRAVKYVR